jgi:DNA-binding NarL/FixJ family response regulator
MVSPARGQQRERDSSANPCSPASSMVSPASDGAGLTEPESDVLRLTAAGHGAGEVAQLLDVSVTTVRNYLSSIYRKLDAHDRTEAVVSGVHRGIIAVS